MLNLSLNARRFGAGCVLALTMFTIANHISDWNLFGQWDKQVMGGAVAALFLYLIFVGPSLEEVWEYQERRRSERQVSVSSYAWVAIATVACVMAVLAFIGPVLKLARSQPVHAEDWYRLAAVEVLVAVGGIVGWWLLQKLRREAERKKLNR